MSLSFFHIFFIGSAVTMCIASAVLIALLAGDESWAIPSIVLAAVCTVGLLVYGRSFLKKIASLTGSK